MDQENLNLTVSCSPHVHAPDGTYYDDIRRIQAFAVTSEHRDIGVCRLESQWFVDGKALERKTGE